MYHKILRTYVFGWLWICCSVVALAATPDRLLVVVGRGSDGKPAYHGGGKVEFLDVSLGAQVVHVDAAKRFHLPLAVRYRVIAPAPIVLTSRLGTEYWRVYDFKQAASGAVYTDEQIDLHSAGEHIAQTTWAWRGKRYGPVPQYGLVGILGRSYFLIDQPDGHWLDVVNPPPFFDRPELGRKLTFTFADLTKYKLEIADFQSTWSPGGPFRVRFTVTDAAGRHLPVVNVAAKAECPNQVLPLHTEWTAFSEPTGWMVGTLGQSVPARIRIAGTVRLQARTKLETRNLSQSFSRGTGQISAQQFHHTANGYQLPRNAAGVVRETRAIWVGTRSELGSKDVIDKLVDHCRDARLNVIVPDVFVRNSLLAKIELMPVATPVAEAPGFDPLKYLIARAHAVGIEVHPWFCVTYRDAAFRKWFRQKYHVDVSIVDADGKSVPLGADVHNPEYRQFVVDLMTSVARHYAVDGIHLDYIRTMSHCYCKACRGQFAKQFGKPITQATDQDWMQWNRPAIGDIVARTARQVRKVRPHAIMSAAVFANMHSGALQGQDPAGWARAGWLDMVMPMDYQMQTLAVRSNERQFLAALDLDDKLVTGLSLYMRAGSTVLSRPADLVCQQIELVRGMGIHGYCLFAHSHLSAAQRQALREKVNRERAVPYFRTGR